MTIEVSRLPKAWLVDVDGTVFLHNGHLSGEDQPLPGVVEFLNALPAGDMVILMTARDEGLRGETERALARHKIRYDRILFGLPVGERILINDKKPSGLATAHAINLDRNAGLAGLAERIRESDL